MTDSKPRSEQVIDLKVQILQLKSQIARLQNRSAGRMPWPVPTIEVLVQAVREYRAGGTSIRKLVAKYRIERGRLWRAIKEAEGAMPKFDKPGKHVYRTKAQIIQGHREFLARLAEED